MQHKINGTQVDTFTWHYLTAMFWTEEHNEELTGKTVFDIHADSLAKIIDDCQKFQDQGKNLLLTMYDEQAGADFWFTRNRHGVGFWDRGLGEIGDKLTALAHTFGESNVYLGDDNMVHVS